MFSPLQPVSTSMDLAEAGEFPRKQVCTKHEHKASLFPIHIRTAILTFVLITECDSLKPEAACVPSKPTLFYTHHLNVLIFWCHPWSQHQFPCRNGKKTISGNMKCKVWGLLLPFSISDVLVLCYCFLRPLEQGTMCISSFAKALPLSLPSLSSSHAIPLYP